jgi:hypothetical protein
MDIYEINDCEWYLADSPEEALRSFCETVGATEEEARTDYDANPRLLPADELEKLWFTEEDLRTKKTFGKKREEMLAAGVDGPCFFATTEF